MVIEVNRPLVLKGGVVQGDPDSDELRILRTIAVRNQAGHGLVAGEHVRLDGSGDYVKALADSEANSWTVGQVVEVDGDDFVVALPGGYVSGLSGLTPGGIYYLSRTTPGAMTTTPPATGEWSRPVFLAETATTGFLIDSGPLQVGAGGGGGGGFGSVLSSTMTLPGGQVADLGAGQPIQFSSNDGGDHTVSGGRWTIPEGQKGTCVAGLRGGLSANSAVATFQFYNVTTGLYVGNKMTVINTNRSGTMSFEAQGLACQVDATGGAVEMELHVESLASGSVIAINEDGAFVSVLTATTPADVAAPSLERAGVEELVHGEWWEDPNNPGDYYPVYLKLIDLGALPNASSGSVPHGITGYFWESIRFIGGAAENGAAMYPIPNAHPTSASSMIRIDIIGANIGIQTAINWSAYNGWVRLKYSKSTDTPTQNPYGNGGRPDGAGAWEEIERKTTDGGVSVVDFVAPAGWRALRIRGLDIDQGGVAGGELIARVSPTGAPPFDALPADYKQSGRYNTSAPASGTADGAFDGVRITAPGVGMDSTTPEKLDFVLEISSPRNGLTRTQFRVESTYEASPNTDDIVDHRSSAWRAANQVDQAIRIEFLGGELFDGGGLLILEGIRS